MVSPQQKKPQPTGKVVGRENLSPEAQAAIARLEAKRELPPDMQYTRNGKRISAEEFNRGKGMMNAVKEGGSRGIVDHMLSGAKNMFGGIMDGAKNMLGGMFKPGETTTIVRDGNVGIMTPELQKAVDRLNATRARADKLEAENKAMSTQGGLRKQLEKDPLFAEYERAYDDPKHPLHDQVVGDLFDDTGTKHPLRFEEFKKLKQQQSQAKLSPNQSQQNSVSSNISPPSQPPVTVITAPQGQSTPAKGGGGGGETPEQLPTFSASGNSRDRSRNTKILGIF